MREANSDRIRGESKLKDGERWLKGSQMDRTSEWKRKTKIHAPYYCRSVYTGTENSRKVSFIEERVLSRMTFPMPMGSEGQIG
jgi:hypothetical protein